MATVKQALNGKSLETGTVPETTGGTHKGLTFRRYFTDGKKSPFDLVEWEKRTALIGNEKGVTIFRQEDIEVPKNWSQTATNIVVSKYFYGKLGSPERETSVAQLVERHRGSVHVWSTQRYGASGTAFSIFLPTAHPSEARGVDMDENALPVLPYEVSPANSVV